MPKGYKEGGLIEFEKEFGNEEACAKHLAEQRWPNGFLCPRCGHNKAWNLSERHLYDCKHCRYQVSVTAGTVFHGTRSSLVKWYRMIYHMAMSKSGVSTAELQRLLDIKEYRTAWLMAHKIRRAMADRDGNYTLAALVVMKGPLFGPDRTERGRESKQKSIVLCAIFFDRNRRGKHPIFAHMQVVNNDLERTREVFLQRLGCGSTTKKKQDILKALKSEGWAYRKRRVKNNDTPPYKMFLPVPNYYPREAIKLLDLVDRVINNTKAVIRSAHRGVSEKHLQAYLVEICYRFNQRFWEKKLFDRLVKSCVSTEPLTHDRLVSGD